MKRFTLSFLLIFTLLLTSCVGAGSTATQMMSGGMEDSYKMADMAEMAPAMLMAGDTRMMDIGGPVQEETESKVIQTGSLNLHVDDVQDSVKTIAVLVKGWGGSVQNQNISRGDSSYSASVDVRVPADQFDTAIEGLKEEALYVENEWVNSDDITEAYMDLEARLNNAYAEEEAYLKLMNRAASVNDILQVTRSLSNVRSSIEYMESQKERYDTQVSYSSISLYLTEDDSVSSVAEKWRPGSTVSGAFGDFIVFLQWLVDASIYVIIFGWPLLILGYFVRKKFKKRK